MSTKAQIISEAYVELRISGLTVTPSPEDQIIALSRLESMMADLFGQYNFDIGYNFEEEPDVNSESGIPFRYKNMAVLSLAVRLIAAFNKTVPMSLQAQAASALSAALGSVSAANLREIQPPRRMPAGSGNRLQNQFFSRFMSPVALPPNTSYTNRILVGETFTYAESFSAWLRGETISSYAIVADPRLTIVTSANADPEITYTITATNAEPGYPWQQAKITVTSSGGRVDIRIINFEVLAVPDVG